MTQSQAKILAQTTCLYYRDYEAASKFYETVMGFEKVQDEPGWYRMYRTAGNSYITVIDERRGVFKAQEKNSVLIMLVVDDVQWWFEALKKRGAKLLSEIKPMPQINARCFFLEDPGGYSIEIEQFLSPETGRLLQAR